MHPTRISELVESTDNKVKLLTEWAMPEFGEFECDYITSRLSSVRFRVEGLEFRVGVCCLAWNPV